MRITHNIFSHLSVVTKYRFQTILFIALFWTLTDTVVVLTLSGLPKHSTTNGFILREVIVLLMSLIMGYLLVFTLRKIFRNFYLWSALLIKSVILIAAAFLMNLLLFSVNSVSILGVPVKNVFHFFYGEEFQTHLLLQKIFYWLILFVITQLVIEINEKYSPGVFMNILFGKYTKPKVEKRIVMFIDIKDSTTIAEKLGHQLFFTFIKEFIYHVSNALIEYGGRIYQYVRDEIVVSWILNESNCKKCMKALIEARKNLQQNGEHFRRIYNTIPEFRVGIHCGDVTVGEIGVIKKDLAMSGDTMNTTARIRSACSELNQKFIVSKDFLNTLNLEEWQTESLGMVELKGKAKEIELFCLKI
ncbi:MAG: adenylate/guanylate cyclase domain-containing protein [Chitinophagaceae bacterium]